MSARHLQFICFFFNFQYSLWPMAHAYRFFLLFILIWFDLIKFTNTRFIVRTTCIFMVWEEPPWNYKKEGTCLSIRFGGVISIWFFSVLCYFFVVHLISALQTMNWVAPPLMTSSLFPASATLRLPLDPLICAISAVSEPTGTDPFLHMLEMFCLCCSLSISQCQV